MTFVEIACRFGSTIGASPDTCTCSLTPCTPSVTRSGTLAAGADGHGAVEIIGEALQRRLDLVGAGGQVQEVRFTLRVGDRRLFCGPVTFDGDAGQHGAGASVTVTSMRPVNTCAFTGVAAQTMAASTAAAPVRHMRCEFVIGLASAVALSKRSTAQTDGGRIRADATVCDETPLSGDERQ